MMHFSNGGHAQAQQFKITGDSILVQSLLTSLLHDVRGVIALVEEGQDRDTLRQLRLILTLIETLKT